MNNTVFHLTSLSKNPTEYSSKMLRLRPVIYRQEIYFQLRKTSCVVWRLVKSELLQSSLGFCRTVELKCGEKSSYKTLPNLYVTRWENNVKNHYFHRDCMKERTSWHSDTWRMWPWVVPGCLLLCSCALSVTLTFIISFCLFWRMPIVDLHTSAVPLTESLTVYCVTVICEGEGPWFFLISACFIKLKIH